MEMLRQHQPLRRLLPTTAGKPMVSRIGASKAIKHTRLRCLNVQDMVASGVVRLRKVDTKDSLAYLHTKLLPVDRMRHL